MMEQHQFLSSAVVFGAFSGQLKTAVGQEIAHSGGNPSAMVMINDGSSSCVEK